MKFYETAEWQNLDSNIKREELKKRYDRINEKSTPKTKQKFLELYMQTKAEVDSKLPEKVDTD